MWSIRSAAVVLCSFAVLALLPKNAVAQKVTRAKTDNTEVRQLQQERLATLERGVAVVERQYQEGVIDFSRVQQLQLDWLNAAIDLPSSPKERIDLLTSQLAVARSAWQNAEAQYNAGRVSELDVLQAKSAQLLVAIELTQARNNMAANSDLTPAVEGPQGQDTNSPDVSQPSVRSKGSGGKSLTATLGSPRMPAGREDCTEVSQIRGERNATAHRCLTVCRRSIRAASKRGLSRCVRR